MAPGPRPPYWSEKGRSVLGVELASTKLTLAKGRKGSIWQHPELIITGLSKTVAHQMLDIIAVHIEEKRPIDLSTTTDALLTGYTCIPAALSRRRSRITTSTSDFARCTIEETIPLYQIVWPSKDGHFPWHPSATESFRRWQPVLDEHPGRVTNDSAYCAGYREGRDPPRRRVLRSNWPMIRRTSANEGVMTWVRRLCIRRERYFIHVGGCSPD
jgi:hypothetical protein